MNIRLIKQDELSKWHSDMLHAIKDGRKAMTIICLFGGDRLYCCDEAVVAEENGKIVSIASIAPEGEQRDGRPTIVGLYTLDDYRRQGIGIKVMQAAIERCVARGLTPIHVDIMSTGAKHLFSKLPDDLKCHLELNDQSGFMDLI